MKVKTKKPVKRAPKPIARPSYNLRHEDMAHKIEKAFKSGTIQYYKFIDDHQIPAGRYKYIYAALKEADMRMSGETLDLFIAEGERILNGGDKKNMISVGELWKLILNLKSRRALAFEPASVERLAAVIYFDENEDLSTYDRMHGMRKVEHWKKNKTLDFFLTRPIVELFGLKGCSITSLEAYIQQTEEVIKDLTFDLQKASSENSSASGKSPS